MVTLVEWHEGALPLTLGGVFSRGSFESIWPFEWVNVDHNGSGPARAYWDFSSLSPVMSLRVYFRTPPQWSSNTNRFFGLRSEDGADRGGLAFAGEANSGQLRLTTSDASGSTIVVATSPLRIIHPLRWYRFELLRDFTQSLMRARVSHIHMDAPVWDSGWVDVDEPIGSTAPTRVDLGATQGSLLLGHSRFAHLDVVDNASFLGRHTTDTFPWNPPLGSYGSVRIRKGAELVAPSSVKLFEGNRLINAIAMQYQGVVVPEEPPPPVIGVSKAIQSFEGQTNGQPLSLSAPWSIDSGQQVDLFMASENASLYGSMGARVEETVGYTRINYMVAEDVSGSDIVVYDWHFRVRSRTTDVWLFKSENAAFDIRYNVDGTIRLRANNNLVSASTQTLDLNTWYRMSLRLSQQGMILRVYNLNNEVLLEMSGPLVLYAWTGVRFGLTAASNGTNMDLDMLRIGDEWLSQPN